jgi:hypothetical protein
MTAPRPVVFISHAEENKDVAFELRELLRRHGYDAWLYEEHCRPGISHHSQVHVAIHGASALAILISRSSFASRYVAWELRMAVDLNKPVIPILLGLSHSSLRHVDSGSWDEAIGNIVSVEVPPEGLPQVESRIVSGLVAVLEGSTGHGARASGPPHPRRSEDSPTVSDDSDDGMREVVGRLEAFDPGIGPLRRDLARDWDELDRGSHGERDPRGLAFERAGRADTAVQDLVEVVRQNAAPPKEFAIIARGGYGMGLLSLGSDLDVAFLHRAGTESGESSREQAAAEAFYVPFARGLRDVCGAVTGLRASPTLLTTGDCVRDFRRIFQEGEAGDFCSLVSFTFTRHLVGATAMESELRLAWTTVLRELTDPEIRFILARVSEQVGRSEVDPDAGRIDLKLSAGGILEFRLGAFLEHLISIRQPGTVQPDMRVAEAHRFLLWTRDATFQAGGSHILTRRSLPGVLARIAGSGLPIRDEAGFRRHLARCLRIVRGNLLDRMARLP